MTKPPTPINVGLYDYAGLGPGSDAAIEKRVGDAFRRAGIAMAWQTYMRGKDGKLSGPANAAVAPLTLNLLPHLAKGARVPLDASAAGYTPAGSAHSTVLYDAAVKQALDAGIPAQQVAAMVAEHELGHALGLGHTNQTIMSPHWTADHLMRIGARNPWNPAQIRQLQASAQKLSAPNALLLAKSK